MKGVCTSVLIVSCTLAACSHSRAGHDAAADRLLAQGSYANAVEAYERQIPRARGHADKARLRLFLALARLGDGAPEQRKLAYAELRTLEQEQRNSVWGSLARVLVGELTRREALQDALASFGAKLRQVEQRVEELERQLATNGVLEEEQRKQLESLKEERDRLNREIKEMTAKLASQAQRLTELEQELAGLKQIDMQRQP